MQKFTNRENKREQFSGRAYERLGGLTLTFRIIIRFMEITQAPDANIDQ